MKIKTITCRQVLDSRRRPTLKTTVSLEDKSIGSFSVPSGASTGIHEAVELRDSNSQGIRQAIANTKGPIRNLLIGQNAYNQEKVDQLMIDLDGTKNKSKLGGNAIIGVSGAVCRAAAKSQKMPLFKYLGKLSGNNHFVLPTPLILMIEGGKHGDWITDIQEYMIIPQKNKFPKFTQRLEAGNKIYRQLKKILEKKGFSAKLGFEGAFMPPKISSNEQAFQLIVEAVKKAGYQLKNEVNLAIDAAASEFYHHHKYHLKSEKIKLNPKKWRDTIINWTKKYPLKSVEDPCGQENWTEWARLISILGKNTRIVGDDLTTTNAERIRKAHQEKAINAVIIKPNQIGTISETIKAINLAHSYKFITIVSHRSGETNDDFIADLAVGAGCPQVKFGAPSQKERLAKYNRLLQIEKELE